MVGVVGVGVVIRKDFGAIFRWFRGGVRWVVSRLLSCVST